VAAGSVPCRADEQDDLAAGVAAFRAADFATAIRLLEPLGDAPALGDHDRARALGTLGLCLLATGDRDRAVAPLRRLAVLAPGVRLGVEELAPEYRAFFDQVRREVLGTIHLADRTAAVASRRVRFEATLEDPLSVVARVEARTDGRTIPLAATDLGARRGRSLAAEVEIAGGSYRIVALARDRTEVARTGSRPAPRTRPSQAAPAAPRQAEEQGARWVWPAVGVAAGAAVVVVSVVLIVGASSPGHDGCGSLGCLEF
jgi:hypothetical protein